MGLPHPNLLPCQNEVHAVAHALVDDCYVTAGYHRHAISTVGWQRKSSTFKQKRKLTHAATGNEEENVSVHVTASTATAPTMATSTLALTSASRQEQEEDGLCVSQEQQGNVVVDAASTATATLPPPLSSSTSTASTTAVDIVPLNIEESIGAELGLTITSRPTPQPSGLSQESATLSGNAEATQRASTLIDRSAAPTTTDDQVVELNKGLTVGEAWRLYWFGDARRGPYRTLMEQGMLQLRPADRAHAFRSGMGKLEELLATPGVDNQQALDALNAASLKMALQAHSGMRFKGTLSTMSLMTLRSHVGQRTESRLVTGKYAPKDVRQEPAIAPGMW